MIHVSEKFVPEVLTYLFEEWTGSALLWMGPLCYRWDRSVIDLKVPGESLSMPRTSQLV